MAAAFMWLLILSAASVIGCICMIPSWIVRKIRERRADDFFRKKYNGGWEEGNW